MNRSHLGRDLIHLVSEFAELLRYVPCGHNATKRACSAIQSLRGEPIESLVKAGGLPREALLADYGICRISGRNRPTNWLGTRRSIDPGSGDSMPIAEDHIGFASVSKVSRRFGCIRAHVVKLFEHGIRGRRLRTHKRGMSHAGKPR